jgi:hypothetical protein
MKIRIYRAATVKLRSDNVIDKKIMFAEALVLPLG